MNITIREADEKDFRDIQKMNSNLFKFEEKNFSPCYNLKWPVSDVGIKYFKNSIINKNACALVAVVDEKIIGYLIGWIKEKHSSYRLLGTEAELENMFIKKKFRNKGAGSILIERFLTWCKEQEVKNVCVSALAKNMKAMAFYKSIGFEEYEVKFEMSLLKK
jgi:ribosomal protein S18 acetylase RimI-like enzyme